MKKVITGILLMHTMYSYSQSIPIDSATIVFYGEAGLVSDSISNSKLLDFVCYWHSAPYKYAGKSVNGVDCSSFAKILYKNVYQIHLEGTSTTLHKQCELVLKNDLQEGDLLFFNIYGDRVSHVGVYLGNNKFAHASTKLGVTINDLNQSYYLKRFASAGRIPTLVAK